MLMRLPVSVPVVRVSLFSGLLVRPPAKLDRVVQEGFSAEMIWSADAIHLNFQRSILKHGYSHFVLVHTSFLWRFLFRFALSSSSNMFVTSSMHQRDPVAIPS